MIEELRKDQIFMLIIKKFENNQDFWDYLHTDERYKYQSWEVIKALN